MSAKFDKFLARLVEKQSGGGEPSGFPDDASEWDILMFQTTIDRGNSAGTKLLIQPIAGESAIVDSAHGNAAPVTIEQGNSGSPVTVSADGALQFPGSGSYLRIPVAGFSQVITGSSEFCIDLVLSPGWESGTRKILHLGSDGWYAYLNPESGTFWFFGKGHDNLQMGLSYQEEHLLTLEQWKDGDTWKLSLYTDGSLMFTFDMQIGASSSEMRFGIGDNDEGGGFIGTMNNIRLRNYAPYRGVSFSPQERPYQLPIAGWSTCSLADLKAKLEALT